MEDLDLKLLRNDNFLLISNCLIPVHSNLVTHKSYRKHKAHTPTQTSPNNSILLYFLSNLRCSNLVSSRRRQLCCARQMAIVIDNTVISINDFKFRCTLQIEFRTIIWWCKLHTPVFYVFVLDTLLQTRQINRNSARVYESQTCCDNIAIIIRCVGRRV